MKAETPFEPFMTGVILFCLAGKLAEAAETFVAKRSAVGVLPYVLAEKTMAPEFVPVIL